MSSKKSGVNRKRMLWLAIVLIIAIVLIAIFTVQSRKNADETPSEKSAGTAGEAGSKDEAEAVSESESENEAETVSEAEKATESSGGAAADKTEDSSETAADTSKETSKAAEEENAGLEFPYEADDGNLEIVSLFQNSSMNPDSGNEVCEDTASIQLKNTSGKYLKSADISVELDDGTAYSFLIKDLPADKSLMAFDTSNAAYDGKAPVAVVETKSDYSEDASLQADVFSVEEDESNLKIKNLTGETLDNVTVIWHGILDDMYFGGTSYESSLESLAAGETKEVDISSSLLGGAEAVSITYGK